MSTQTRGSNEHSTGKVRLLNHGGQVKTLLDVVKELDTLNNEETIYATLPWLPASEAVVMHENSWSQNNTLTKSFIYFLEVAIAQEFMTDWIASNDTTASAEAKCERLIEYATKDS